jgi:hypothetical protein
LSEEKLRARSIRFDVSSTFTLLSSYLVGALGVAGGHVMEPSKCDTHVPRAGSLERPGVRGDEEDEGCSSLMGFDLQKRSWTRKK